MKSMSPHRLAVERVSPIDPGFRAFRMGIALVCAALIGVAGHVAAAVTDCVEQGGQAVCGKPQVESWRYNLCDEAGTFASRYKAWCEVRGGTWLGVYDGCRGATPDAETNLFSRAVGFATNLYRPYGSVCTGTDTGWGQTISSNLCWSGGPTYQNGVLTRDFRTISVSCTPVGGETIRAGRWRDLVCPVGTLQRVVGSQTVCVHPIDASCGVGNPILPATGKKTQTELDLVFDGLQFQRMYSSRGSIFQYAAGAGPVSVDSLWRHTFDIRLQLISTSVATSAAVSWPDGQIQYFKGSGQAILATNDNSARLSSSADAHVLRFDGMTYRFTSEGVLSELATWSGRSFSLRYADGTLGPGGQVARDSGGASLASPVPAGHLIEVVSSTGRQLRFDRDVAGRLTQLWPPGAAAPIRYSYGPDEHLARVRYGDGSTREYYYNEPGLTSGANLPDALTSVFVGSGSAVRYAAFAYNSAGQAISTEHAGGVGRHALSFVTPGRATLVQEPLGFARTHYFTEVAGVMKSSGQAQVGGSGCLASTSAQTFDSNGNVFSRDDFNGNRSCLAHDPGRNLETVRVDGLVGGSSGASCASSVASGVALPIGARKTSTEWHVDLGLRTRIAEPGRIVTHVYNGQPDPLAGGAIARCAPAASHLPDGKPIAVLCRQVEQPTTDPDGALGFAAALQGGVAVREKRWTYNEHGQVLTHDGSRTDVADITLNEYYADTAFTGADPYAVGHTRGDLKQTTSPAGHVTRYTLYNKMGQLLEMVDPNGIATSHSYDLRQRLTSTTVGGQTTTFAYWPNGLIQRVTQPDGNWVHYEHDDAHRLTKISDNLGNSVAYTLDNLGNRTAEVVRDPANVLRRQLTRSIDALGRVQLVTGRE
jgi:YD repeat-containing protein